MDHAHAVGVVRQPRFAARQPPPSCPSTVTTTRKPTVVSPSASPEASSVLGLLPGVEATRALARQPCVGLLLASRFVCAISVSCVGRHTTTTFMPFAARLGIIKVPQGQSAMAVAARSSEQVVLGSAGLRWAAVFSGRLRPLGSTVKHKHSENVTFRNQSGNSAGSVKKRCVTGDNSLSLPSYHWLSRSLCCRFEPRSAV